MIPRRTKSAIALALTLVACGQRSEPLGKLPRAKLAEWAEDCETPIVEEPAIKGKDPTMVGKRWRETTFQHATHRFVCKPPGWAVYVGDNDRIVGLCVDDRKRLPMEDYLPRARRLLSRHFGEALTTEIASPK